MNTGTKTQKSQEQGTIAHERIITRPRGTDLGGPRTATDKSCTHNVNKHKTTCWVKRSYEHFITTAKSTPEIKMARQEKSVYTQITKRAQMASLKHFTETAREAE